MASISRPVEETIWQRMLQLLHGELAVGARRALARGITAERLAAGLDERTALLRAHLSGLRVTG